MAKRLKILNAILCEHVVAGAGGKFTLVNVFSGDIVLATMPATLTFGLYVELAKETTPPSLKVEFLYDGDVVVALQAQFPAPDPNAPVTVLAVPVMHTGVDKDLSFEVVASAEGYARTLIMKKRIFKA